MWGENIQKIHEGCFLYSQKTNPYYPYTSMSPHSHPSMLPHNYPSMPPQPICLCKYCIYSTIYALYVVAHYLHITYLGYLHHPLPSIIHSSMLRNLIPPDLHPHHSRRMNEHRGTRRNQRSNPMNRNRRDYSIIR